MTIVEMLPVEKWIELEMGINKRSNLNASVFDANGIRITNYKKWAHRLCPVVKADEKGQSYICAVAHQNAANQAQKTRAPAIVECDAGLVKVVVPIFENDEFLGVAGGCGLLLKDSEVDTFLVDKTTDTDPGEIENLSNDIATISMEQLKSVIKYIEEELQWIIHNYHNHRLVSAG
jgi:ligand-binding sensor protein